MATHKSSIFEGGASGAVADKGRALPVSRECRELTPADMERFYDNLCRTRRQLVEEIGRLQRLVAAHVDDASPTPIRGRPGVEISSDGRMWERLQALADRDRKLVVLCEIDHALERMAQKQYGLCVVDQAEISKGLLEQLPWASRCVDCLNAP